MIEYAPQALRHIEDLRRHYEQLERVEALRALAAALAEAEREIEADPTSGLPAPRPYPQLAGPGRAWVKAGRYWIAYRITPKLTIAGVFFDTANIPGRI